jgi:deazaflavin-dependent oxidoreductase (nitroreductase family)
MEHLNTTPAATRKPMMPARMDRLPYPFGLSRAMLRLPIYGYRLGLGWLMQQIGLMVLTTWGRKSGLPRHTAIEYRTHGSKVYVVSAWGRRPNWYRNLIEQPVVRIRMGRHRFSARASVVEDSGEALRVLYLFRKRAPVIYDAILAHLSEQDSVDVRTLPDVSDRFTIVRFDPSNEVVGPPTVDADLRWLWAAAGMMLLALWGLFRPRSKAR